LDLALLQRAVVEAAGLGYNLLSISGGEPLLYEGLFDLCGTAREAGMITSLVSNGLLITEKRYASITDLVDVLALSVDGRPAQHNRSRNHPRAFEVLQSRVDGLRSAGIPFAFLFTVSAENLGDIEWVAQFAASQRARTLQVHALESVGRGPANGRLDRADAALLFLVVERLREVYSGRLQIELDLLDATDLAEAIALTADARPRLPSPLVVESDGAVVPLRYGFCREWALGNLREDGLAALAARWDSGRGEAFAALAAGALSRVSRDELAFINPYAVVAEAAAESKPESDSHDA
jgi:MoaA/NifB/PqqE/SkfB family radical SAM enzyme